MNAGKLSATLIRPVWLFAFALAAAGAEPPQPPAKASIEQLVADYCADTGADVGLHAVRLADGTPLCQIRPTDRFIPASNQKILTSAVALKRLGPDFQFRTKLATAGRDLVVIGDGDPTTGDARLAEDRKETIYAAFDRWAEALKRAGIRRIEGDLLIRAGTFQGPYSHPDWPTASRQRWYAAPAAAVNFNDNCFDVGFEVEGEEVRPVVAPLSRFIRVRSRVRLGGRHLWRCRFDKSGDGMTLTGTVRRATPDPLPVAAPDPPMLFGCVLMDRLVRAGIEFQGKIVVSRDPAGPWRADGLRVIATEATPLSAVLRRANKHSHNLTAECLFLRSAVEPGAPATWKKAAKAAAAVLQADYGLPAGQFRVADGSGLSGKNRVSPAAITSLLGAMAGQKAFLESLAIAGVDGSLEGRLAGPLCRGRILGKTGSLTDVSALSGYVLDRTGKPALAFSILINGRTRGKRHDAHGLQAAVCRVLTEAVDAPAP